MKIRLTIMLITLIVMTVVMPMIIPGQDGKPMMTIDDWIPDVTGMKNTVVDKFKEVLYTANEAVEGNTGVSVGIERPKLYKWQDENGTWHFSDRADSALTNQTSQMIPKIKNTMGAPPKIDFGDSDNAGSGRSVREPSIPLPLSVGPDKISKLIDDVKNVQKMADDRATKINQIR